MEIPDGLQKIGKELGWNTSRIIAFPYFLFLILCSLHWLGWTSSPKDWFLFLANAIWLHTFGIVSIILTVISLLNNHSRNNFFFHISQIFKSEPKDLENSILNESNLTDRGFVQSLMEWSKDAHEIYIFGGSANFLKENNTLYNLEFEELKELGAKCKILIRQDFTANIDKLWDLSKSGVEIRTYPFGDLHIRGRLKKDTLGIQSYLCSKKNGKYTTQSIPLMEVSKLLLFNFNDLFSKGGNPFIKCIMFDKGGVWCEMVDNKWIINYGIRELAKNLNSKNYTVIIHSNCKQSIGKKLKAEGFFSGYRQFFSYEMKSRKPEQEFYKEILQKLNLRPYQCVFIDDRINNIDSARKLDINVIWIDKNEKCDNKPKIISEELKKLQVPF